MEKSKGKKVSQVDTIISNIQDKAKKFFNGIESVGTKIFGLIILIAIGYYFITRRKI
jgi:hypothetical protein